MRFFYKGHLYYVGVEMWLAFDAWDVKIQDPWPVKVGRAWSFGPLVAARYDKDKVEQLSKYIERMEASEWKM